MELGVGGAPSLPHPWAGEAVAEAVRVGGTQGSCHGLVPS